MKVMLLLYSEAIALAKRCPTPGEGGVVEIRPLMNQG